MSQVNLTAGDFTLIKDDFTETACGVGVFGVHALLFLTTIYTLLRKNICKSRLRQILLAIALVMFAGASLTEMVYIRLFMINVDSLHFGTVSYTELNNLYKITVVCGRINYLLSDGIVVWRAYVLYPLNRKIKMLLVICMVVGLVAAFVEGAQALRLEARTHESRKGVTAFILFIPLLVTNMLATCLVAYKAWEYYKFKSLVTSDDGQTSNKTTVESVLLLIVESGLIYITYWIVTMLSALGVMGPQGDNILECILPQIPGIYLMMVILLVAFQKTISSTTVTPASVTETRSAIRFAHVATPDVSGGQSPNDIGLPFSVQSTPPQIGASFVSRLKDDSDWISEKANDVEKGSASGSSRSTSIIAV